MCERQERAFSREILHNPVAATLFYQIKINYYYPPPIANHLDQVVSFLDIAITDIKKKYLQVEPDSSDSYIKSRQPGIFL